MSIPEHANPLDLFDDWFEEAKNCNDIAEPLAMTLATVDENQMPWPRTVLLKGHDEDGFTFYTNLGSRKARHLQANPKAGLCFYWMPLNKQVRIVGKVELVEDEVADAYFATRPRESQLGAWASRQSEPMPSLEDLMQRLQKYATQFGDGDVPRPDFWSGYRVVPDEIEFWLRGEFRLHHRRAYTRQPGGVWTSQLLFP